MCVFVCIWVYVDTTCDSPWASLTHLALSWVRCGWLTHTFANTDRLNGLQKHSDQFEDFRRFSKWWNCSIFARTVLIYWVLGVLFCCNRNQTLFILFKATVFHHGWHKQGWKIHEMKWNQIVHRTVFVLWFKATHEFTLSVTSLYFHHVWRAGWVTARSILLV